MSEGIQARFIDELCEARRNHAVGPGTREACESAARAVLGFLFPHLAPPGAGAPVCEPTSVRAELAALSGLLQATLSRLPGLEEGPPDRLATIASSFLARLPALHELLAEDAAALAETDPAARSTDEVMLAYPGFRAVAFYRVAHELHLLGVPLLPRLITEVAHRETGIDIHPGATIGRALAIDHGTGVVIGETAVIGDRVRLFQGVTIGAATVKREQRGRKRHPTLGDEVVVYANATLLGGDTVVGAGSVIGGNVWLTHAVPPRSVVTHEGAATRVRSRDEDAGIEFHI